MNETQIKQALQTFLAANTSYKWDTTDDSFINIYQGEVYGNDSIASRYTKQRLSIELSVKFFSTGTLESLDDLVLSTKIMLDTLIKTIKTNNQDLGLKGLKFENWEKKIESSAYSDSQVQYKAELSMFYSIIVSGFS